MIAKVLGIIGILAALGGAGFTYMNYQEKVTLAGEKENLTTDLGNTKTTLAATEKTLEETKGTLATTEESLKSETAAHEGTKGILASTKTELESTKGELTTAKTEVETEKAAKEAALVQASQVSDLTNTITTLNTDLATARTERDDFKLKYEEALAKAASTPVGPIAGSNPVDGVPIMNATPTGIKGRVQAVNPGWSFVVLNLGEKDGVSPNARLDVYRSGTKVGELKISTVEPSLSTADIVGDGTIEPGDQVITRG